MSTLTLLPLTGLPRVRPGDDLVAILLRALEREHGELRTGDVVVLAQKIVSKAEGRIVALDTVEPSERARELAARVDKDPRLVELILRESNEVVRTAPGVLVVEHRLGFVLANAGIDHSNVEQPEGGAEERVLLLPADPDRSAADLRARLRAATGAQVGVVIADSWGRPWRLGTVGFAIGVAGLPALVDLRGTPDLEGRPLQVTEVGHADQLAAAASILMGQAAESVPAVVIRGLPRTGGESPATALLRPRRQDLFR